MKSAEITKITLDIHDTRRPRRHYKWVWQVIFDEHEYYLIPNSFVSITCRVTALKYQQVQLEEKDSLIVDSAGLQWIQDSIDFPSKSEIRNCILHIMKDSWIILAFATLLRTYMLEIRANRTDQRYVGLSSPLTKLSPLQIWKLRWRWRSTPAPVSPHKSTHESKDLIKPKIMHIEQP